MSSMDDSDDTVPQEDGEEAEDPQQQSSPSSAEPPPPVYHNGRVEFSVDSIHEQLICHLCQGFYREPFTTIRCRHTFCRSCLGIAVDAGCFSCPKCQTYLGKDISKFALPDRILQDLIDKVLFPQVAAEDDAKEAQFYKKRGIARKEDLATSSSDGAADAQQQQLYNQGRRKMSRRDSLREEMMFEVLPEAVDETEDVSSSSNGAAAATMPVLEFPLLQTRGSVHVGQLKKYLQLKLKLDATREIEMLCHGIPLGDELSVAFVSRTVWMEPYEKLKLTYRYAM